MDGSEVILGKWAFVWTLLSVVRLHLLQGACRCSAPSMDTAKRPRNLTQPDQFLFWGIVPPGSAMCIPTRSRAALGCSPVLFHGLSVISSALEIPQVTGH